MRSTFIYVFALAVGTSAVGCGEDDPNNGDATPGTAAATIAESTAISNPAPDLAGTVTLTEAAGMVTLAVSLTDCPEGDHGFHIHAGTGCGTDGSDAMGHWDPLAIGEHGQVGETASHHAGDVGVIACDSSGAGSLTITTDEWSLTDGAQNNPVGQAVILHGVDAKQRIGCGVIEAGGTASVAPMTLTANPAAGVTGTANFSESETGEVEVEIALTGCPEGNHGFHIHAGTGCGPDGSDAMGHWDPAGADAHGQVGESAPHHAGDVGVIACDADGNGSLTLTTDEWTLSDSMADNNPTGQAVILHGIDPANRIACGVIAAQ